MRINSLIEDRQVIRSILEHLGLWTVRWKLPPKIHAPLEIAGATDELFTRTYIFVNSRLLQQTQDEV